MPILNLKIPPVLLVIIFATLMWLASTALPQLQLPNTLKLITFAALTITGALITLAGVLSFRQANTTVNPTTPDAASSLVTTGIYRYTRNPMYVGFLLFLIGWGLYLSSLYALALTAGFIGYMNRFQIKPEEQALESVFGAEVTSYKQRVRRWL
ncbi:MAG: isoprenylcysteine carboxylmethyltransferase family protein [Halopseudomonas sp.]